jgi:predicted alpha/beta hydrolase family esterase
MWFIGRNDCFMHPHVANDLFVGKGYDLYFFNYSCDGMTRKRGWVGPHFNSHNRKSSFDLYIGQIEKALEIVKAGNYEKTLGYAHSTGGPVLINYLMKKGDADFDGFIFNSPFLDWGFVGGDAVEFILEDGIQLLSRLKLMKADFKFGCASTPESFKEPIMYMDEEIVLSAWAAKLFSQWFFDFRCRPLYAVPLTAGFSKGVTGVHDKLLALRNENKYVTKKPFVCISSRADDTLKCSETMKRIDIIGPSRVEIELRHNAHDVFLSEEMNDVKMALNLTRTWMEHNGFE